MEIEGKQENVEQNEVLEIIENYYAYEAGEDNILNEKFKNQDNEIEATIAKLADDEAIDLNEKDIHDVVSELRNLEEKLQET